jgi:hypothetical protein
MITWAEILWSRECTACGARKKPLDFGLVRAFCPICTANLPDRLALHLDRAMRQCWFLQWWRIANRQLRISASKTQHRADSRAQAQRIQHL